MGGYPANSGEHIHDERTAANNTLQLEGIDQLLVEIQCQSPEAAFCDQLGNSVGESADIKGLGQIIGRSLANRFDGRFGGVIPCHQDHFRRWIGC